MANNGVVGIQKQDFDEIIDQVIFFRSGPVQNSGFKFLLDHRVLIR
jgi:hypothetical protein